MEGYRQSALDLLKCQNLSSHVVNFARIMDLLYKDEYAYTQLGGMRVECVTLMLVDPVSI